jgi:VanZ family protein
VHPAWRWAPVVAWAALIFGLSSIPDLGTGLEEWDFTLRKLAHAAEFAVFGFLLVRATGSWGWSIAGGIAYAISDELHQHFVPGRLGTPGDVVVDSLGVLVGVMLAARIGNYHSSREQAERRR